MSLPVLLLLHRRPGANSDIHAGLHMLPGEVLPDVRLRRYPVHDKPYVPGKQPGPRGSAPGGHWTQRVSPQVHPVGGPTDNHRHLAGRCEIRKLLFFIFLTNIIDEYDLYKNSYKII